MRVKGLVCLVGMAASLLACGDTVGETGANPTAIVRVSVGALSDAAEFALPIGTYDFEVDALAGATDVVYTIRVMQGAAEVIRATASEPNPTGVAMGDTGSGATTGVVLTAGVNQVAVTVLFPGSVPEATVTIDIAASVAPDIHEVSIEPASPVATNSVLNVSANITGTTGIPADLEVLVSIPTAGVLPSQLTWDGGLGLFTGAITAPGDVDAGDHPVQISVVDLTNTTITLVNVPFTFVVP